MPQYRQDTQTVNLTAAATTTRIWDKPSGVPYKNLSILVTGPIDATNVTFQVFFGGTFTDGTNMLPPYSADVTTHTVGIAQAVAAAIGTGTTEAADFIYQSTVTFPANNPKKKDDWVLGTTPVVVEFVNGTGGNVDFQVTFVSETVNTNV